MKNRVSDIFVLFSMIREQWIKPDDGVTVASEVIHTKSQLLWVSVKFAPHKKIISMRLKE